MVKVSARVLAVLSVLAAGLCAGALAGPRGNLALLDALKSELLAARKLPAGSRPAPPHQDLGSLPGVSAVEVLRRLGRPSYCEPAEPHGCEHAISMSYEWGPKPPALTTAAQGKNEVVTITTGGPFLLVFEAEHGVVKSVRWQGQR